MRRISAVAGLSIVSLLAVLYLADYSAVRYKIAAGRNPFGSVTIRSYYAVQEKNGKTEYIFNNQEGQTCIHSLFPHLGCIPCWYLTRHPEKQITI